MGSRCRFYDNDKPTQFFHCICKVPDRHHKTDRFAFEPRHKKQFISMLVSLLKCFEIECVSVTVMSTHVHMVLVRHNKVESTLKEAAERYVGYYHKRIDARSQKCRRFRDKLNDLSEFMKILQSRFSRWYNNSFEVHRRGSLWNPRFKSVLIEGPCALKNTIIYVELNCVRANMKKHPSLYNYCSWGIKSRKKRHPFQNEFCRLLREYMGEEWQDKSDGWIISYFEREITRIIAGESGYGGEQLDKILHQFEQQLLMKSNEFWTTGGVISEDESSFDSLKHQELKEHFGLISLF